MRAMVMGAVAAVTLAAGGASAATYTYEYVGQEQFCTTPQWGYCELGESGGNYTGTLSINEDLLPVGKLANSSVSLRASEIDYEPDDIVAGLTTTVVSGADTYVSTTPPTSAGIEAALPSFIEISGLPLDVLINNVLVSYFEWSFGSDAEILTWGGSSFTGGSSDFGSSSTGGDGNAMGFRSPGPGEWTLVSVDPSPVPLPASLTLLGVALAGLGLMRRRVR